MKRQKSICQQCPEFISWDTAEGKSYHRCRLGEEAFKEVKNFLRVSRDIFFDKCSVPEQCPFYMEQTVLGQEEIP